MPNITVLPCLDSPEMAMERKNELWISRSRAAELGKSAVLISSQGWYLNSRNERMDLSVKAAVAQKQSIPPDAALPRSGQAGARIYDETTIQVSNETTLQAMQRLLRDAGDAKILALNFANGLHPGGGFLHGARAQEECLCRSSCLYLTLVGDPMYAHHAARKHPDSTDRAILSPGVPVFRTDDGAELDEPWLADFITCAAPYAPIVGIHASAALMDSRIHRILEIARAFDYSDLILGAWGCGAFGNDPAATAQSFRQHLAGDFTGAFSRIVFAITDWSPERRMLGPFRDVFAGPIPG